MLLFNFLSIPVFYIFTHYFNLKRNQHPDFRIKSFLQGALWFLITLVIYTFFYPEEISSFKLKNLFFHFYLADHLLFLLPAIGGYFLFHPHRPREKTPEDSPRGPFIKALTFFSGFFTLTSVYYFVIHFEHLTLYPALLLPLLRCVSILLTALFIEKTLEAYGFFRILYILLILITPGLLSLIGVLCMYQHAISAFILGFLLLGGGCYLYQQLREN